MLMEIERRICAHLAQREHEMLALLNAIVSLDSPSRSADAVSAVTQRIQSFLEENGLETEILGSSEYGDVVCASVKDAAAARLSFSRGIATRCFR
jgi:hypothetical protein